MPKGKEASIHIRIDWHVVAAQVVVIPQITKAVITVL
jgi:hypothetical protein